MPCCGDVSEEDIAEVAAIGRSAMSEPKEGTVALFATRHPVDVPPYGRATTETPVAVPAAIVEDLCAEGLLGTEQPAFTIPAEDAAALLTGAVNAVIETDKARKRGKEK